MSYSEAALGLYLGCMKLGARSKRGGGSMQTLVCGTDHGPRERPPNVGWIP
jgi:hypothetical protein